MRLYLDSSALAKRYLSERGSEIVLQKIHEASEILLSLLSIPETISALNRLKREGLLTQEVYTNLKGELSRDVAESTIIDLTPSVMSLTIACLEECQVRTLDAIHVASAKESGCDLFLSSDRKQVLAARVFGLTTEFV